VSAASGADWHTISGTSIYAVSDLSDASAPARPYTIAATWLTGATEKNGADGMQSACRTEVNCSLSLVFGCI
jgi:hypothetical protein